jgi:hypothetical protein
MYTGNTMSRMQCLFNYRMFAWLSFAESSSGFVWLVAMEPVHGSYQAGAGPEGNNWGIKRLFLVSKWTEGTVSSRSNLEHQYMGLVHFLFLCYYSFCFSLFEPLSFPVLNSSSWSLVWLYMKEIITVFILANLSSLIPEPGCWWGDIRKSKD